ncbi:MAG: GUN4 domain-containing protein, partial [Cyanobacteria bacterium P01_D01_bin.115]
IKATHNEGLLYPHLQAANDVNSDKAWWRQTILLYAAQTNPARLIKEAMRRGANDLAYACWQETRHTLDNETAKALEVLKPKIQTSRYAELEALLKAGKWVEADSETYRLMITTVGKEKGQWFDKEDLLNFPCEDLKTLDQLWVESSGGKFGFSVQKKIYVDCGVSQADLEAGNFPGDKIWNEFCDRVGWKKEGDYLNYSDLQKDPRFSPKGELPRTRRSGVVVCIFNSSLASRLVNCSR